MKILLYLLPFFLSFPLSGQDNIALVRSKVEIKNLSNNPATSGEYFSNFELHDRMIIVTAKLNGKEGKYILDTGSPMLVLNKKIENVSTQIGGFSKDCDSEIVAVKKFEWAGMSNKNIEAIAFDMSGLVKSLGIEVQGLIGQNLFKNYELLIDIENKKIQLFNPKKSTLHKTSKYSQKINFSLEHHIPVITVKIDGKKYRFGIDTGAEVNVISRDLKEKFEKKLLHNFQVNNLHGIDGISQKVVSANLSNFKIKKRNFSNFNFLFIDFTPLQQGYELEIDGILGYPFLKENKISINYKKQKIYFW